MKLFSIIFCPIFLIISTLNAKNQSTPTIQLYISSYERIAQTESIRSGIPASIILAQGILESGFGNSELCLKSNNHFGIKWNNTKDGDFISFMDDDYDSNGKHIPSKFIKYSSAAESFRHHSDVIMNRVYYKSLFKYSRVDYTKWAYGLKECGYSTDINYGVLLIKLIQTYNLNKFDIPQVRQYTSKTWKGVKTENKNAQSIIVLSPFVFVKTNGQILEENITSGREISTDIIKMGEPFDTNETPIFPNSGQPQKFIFEKPILVNITDSYLHCKKQVKVPIVSTYYDDTVRQLHTVRELFVRGSST